MTAVEFDPAVGRLVVDAPTLDALLAFGAHPDGSMSAAAALRAAGVVVDDDLHPAVAGSLDVLRSPDATLSLSYGGRAAQCWLSESLAVLLMPPRGDGRRTLVRLHPSLLPDALARAVDLGPRPRPAAGVPAETLDVGSGVRRWWTVLVGWATAVGVDGRALEVVDTDSGLYRVDRPGPDGEAWAEPTTPREVWRLLVRAVGRGRLDGLAPLPPHAVLPEPLG